MNSLQKNTWIIIVLNFEHLSSKPATLPCRRLKRHCDTSASGTGRVLQLNAGSIQVPLATSLLYFILWNVKHIRGLDKTYLPSRSIDSSGTDTRETRRERIHHENKFFDLFFWLFRLSISKVLKPVSRNRGRRINFEICGSKLALAHILQKQL